MRLREQVTVFLSERLGSVSEKLQALCKECGEDAFVSFLDGGEIEVSWERDETPAEKKSRLKKRKAARDKQEAIERAEYKRLKAKFESGN